MKNEARRNVQQSAPVHQAHANLAITYDEPSASLFRVESEMVKVDDILGADGLLAALTAA